MKWRGRIASDRLDHAELRLEPEHAERANVRVHVHEIVSCVAFNLKLYLIVLPLLLHPIKGPCLWTLSSQDYKLLQSDRSPTSHSNVEAMGSILIRTGDHRM
jgi:hypothetical protein